jgi:hypothetical protein
MEAAAMMVEQLRAEADALARRVRVAATSDYAPEHAEMLKARHADAVRRLDGVSLPPWEEARARREVQALAKHVQEIEEALRDRAELGKLRTEHNAAIDRVAEAERQAAQPVATSPPAADLDDRVAAAFGANVPSGDISALIT